MSKLPRASHFTSLLHRSFSKSPSPIKPCHFSNSQPHLQSLPNPHRHRNLSIRAFVSPSETKKDEKEKEFKSSTASAKSEGENRSARSSDEEYPSGEFEFKEFGAWKKFGVKLWMLVAFPWERIPNGTVLTMKLRGQVNSLWVMPLHVEREYYLACACEELYCPPSAYFSLYGLTVQASFLGDVMKVTLANARNAYKQFRDRQRYSKSMTVCSQLMYTNGGKIFQSLHHCPIIVLQVDKMEEVAQGRVWTGKEAVSQGLVDAIGGFSRAVAIAKQKANIPRGREVTLVELSRPSPTLPEILVGIGNTVVGVDRTLQELLQDLASSDEIQAWMDGIMFQKLDGVSNSSPFFTLIKDYLSSL
ncbi:hypothetical protein LOK49_LG14G00359 [Camellia lanceoleosa]|uniref:Uncharacterized protein n=1 Tax=Camellia lanceoleosa TaxID=1840588 RepID=A0ACC0F9D0_9ERIC|nr:hypothetical protein LOK49_LG14G00359 [Camellia lanceoleosa]